MTKSMIGFEFLKSISENGNNAYSDLDFYSSVMRGLVIFLYLIFDLSTVQGVFFNDINLYQYFNND